jgi:hypothetical protein
VSLDYSASNVRFDQTSGTYNPSHSNPKYDNTEAGFEFLETLSKELDTTEIEFHSSRSGWAKKAEAYGYMPVMQVFKKEV